MDANQIYCVGHFTTCANPESLHRTPETNKILCVIQISITTKGTIRTIRVHNIFYQSSVIITKVKEKNKQKTPLSIHQTLSSFKKYVKREEGNGEKSHRFFNWEPIIAYFNKQLESLNSPIYLSIKNKLEYLLMSDQGLNPLLCCGLCDCYSLVTLSINKRQQFLHHRIIMRLN